MLLRAIEKRRITSMYDLANINRWLSNLKKHKGESRTVDNLIFRLERILKEG